GKVGLCLYDFTGDGELDLVFGNARGGLSFWRSDLISGITALGIETAAPMVYPNPSNGTVQLTTSGTGPIGGQWVVRNSIGQRVKEFPITGSSTLADLNGLPNGLYTIRGEGKTMTKAVRLVISH
ncbi:MAG: T9SS type A sorting domain-containing protein, partial [Flavobacteriales bacterium]|nr:T9SS type A sorting domain-containing protein [Flavobacteriales bacterium]